MLRHSAGTITRHGILNTGIRCIHSCIYCPNSFLTNDREQHLPLRSAPERASHDCVQALDLLQRRNGISCDIVGGEPLLHNEICEVLRHAAQQGIHTRLITLGQLFLRSNFIDQILDTGLTNIQFRIPATTIPLYNKLTGAKYENLRKTLDYLDSRSFAYTSATPIVEANLDQLSKIAEIISRHNIYRHDFFFPNVVRWWNPGGKICGNQVRYSDVVSSLREATLLLESNGIVVNIHDVPLCIGNGLERNLIQKIGKFFDPYTPLNAGGHQGNANTSSVLYDLNHYGVNILLEYHKYDTILNNGTKIVGMRGSYRYMFPSPCSGCWSRRACEGVNPNYLKAYGSDEFIPREEVLEDPLHPARYNYAPSYIVKTDQFEDVRSVVGPEVKSFLKS